MPSFTFYATAEAVDRRSGAAPVFCDVDPDTFCVTAETVEAALTPRTKAIVPVHLFGNVAPVAELRELGCRCSRTRRRPPGADARRRKAGALGDAATFSFFPSKNLPCLGDGGAIATDDDEVAERARRLRFHGSEDKETFIEVGYNSRLDELQAAVLRVLLPELDGWNDRRRAAAAAYERQGLGEHAALPGGGRRRRATPTTSTSAPLRELPHAARVGARLLPRAGAPPAGASASDARPARHRGGGAHHLALPMGTELDRRAGARGGRGVRVWVDLTNSPHVLVMRPLIAAMRADGHEVEVTARDFAQTLELCERFGIEHTAIGRHRGGRLAQQGGGPGVAQRARSPAGRAGRALRRGDRPRLERRRRVAAALLRIPSATAFDYEWAKVQHHVNCRLARAVVVPEAIPPERLYRYGARGQDARATPGLKEEYYLADFEPDAAVLGRARARPRAARWWSCARRPRCRSTTASRTRCSAGCSSGSRERSADGGPAAHRRAARGARAAGRLRRPRAGGRRAEPGGLRRSGRSRPAVP